MKAVWSSMILGSGLLLASCAAPMGDTTISPGCQRALAVNVDRTTPRHQLTQGAREALDEWAFCSAMAEHWRNTRVTLPAGYEPLPAPRSRVLCTALGSWECVR